MVNYEVNIFKSSLIFINDLSDFYVWLFVEAFSLQFQVICIVPSFWRQWSINNENMTQQMASVRVPKARARHSPKKIADYTSSVITKAFLLSVSSDEHLLDLIYYFFSFIRFCFLVRGKWSLTSNTEQFASGSVIIFTPF
jgi:hypothetical protein